MDEKFKITMRRELLIKILDRDPEDPLYERMFQFYKNIFSQKPGLVVCMSRKSWCVIRLFLPLLKAESVNFDEKRLTHDRMVHPWFSELSEHDREELKKNGIIVIDDTFQTGRAIDDCVRRLKYVYGVDENIITVSVFAMTDVKLNQTRIENGFYTVKESFARPNIKQFQVKWIGEKTILTSKENISKYSNFFVEALHACGEPYVGYIPTFRIPIKAVQNFLGAERWKDNELNSETAIPYAGFLEQNELTHPLNKSDAFGFFNITSEQMKRHDVEAFYISLPDDVEKFYVPSDSGEKGDLSFFPSKHALSIGALRFYLNSKTGTALMVPYISLNDCYADAEIVKEFPPELKPLLEKMLTQDLDKWEDREENLAAYRLLRYASGYLWGIFVLKKWFGLNIEDKDVEIASKGGISSERFFIWLNSFSAVKDLKEIWPFFANGKNVVTETQGVDLNKKKNLKDIFNSGLYKDDKNYFSDVISNGLTMSDPLDYYATVSMMFRYIHDREHEKLYKYTEEQANSNKEISLPSPFHGFSIHTFFAMMLLFFPQLKKRKDVPISVMLMLCDMGIAVTQLCQRKKVIGTILFNGEQSCHSLAPLAPEYARFLSDFPNLLKKIPNKEERQKKYKIAETEIKKYFKNERKLGFGRRLPLKDLMHPLKKFKKFAEGGSELEIDPYSVLPKDSFFDCSELFFLRLRKKLVT